MDTVFKVIIIMYLLSFLTSALIGYNRTRWHDELHGLCKVKSKPQKKDA